MDGKEGQKVKEEVEQAFNEGKSITVNNRSMRRNLFRQVQRLAWKELNAEWKKEGKIE